MTELAGLAAGDEGTTGGVVKTLLTGMFNFVAKRTREIVLDAAGELFYTAGISITGVDAVARRAGITKPTLYAHFGSKAELVAAVLRQRFEQRSTELEAWLEDYPRADQALAVMDWLTRYYTDGGDRGCGFLNAAAELTDQSAPGLSVVRAEKDWLYELLVEKCGAAGCSEPETTASQFLLLIDGVAGRAVTRGRVAAHGAAIEARQAAETLLEASRTR